MPDGDDRGWAVGFVRPEAWRAARRESGAGRFGGSSSSLLPIIGTAKQNAEDHHVRYDRGRDDDDGDVIRGAEVAHDAGAAGLNEGVGEIDEADDAHSPCERDAEPRARPKRCDGCKRENSGERRPEGGRYRETLRERGSHPAPEPGSPGRCSGRPEPQEAAGAPTPAETQRGAVRRTTAPADPS